ncbi:MAG: phytoene desaturase [Bacteroidia bacterium]|nr:phytoene desaturase [Bacteroidia bacterium]
MKKVVVIGSGIAGLSVACYLAKSGYKVTILEKNNQAGGRARQFKEAGFTFDMGPSWYWMPDVFEKFYKDFGHTTSDFYDLIRLNPSYRVISKSGEEIDIPANMNDLENLFERFEQGSSIKLRSFLEEAKYKYEVGINDLVYKPGLSLLEFADLKLLKGLLKMDVLGNMRTHIHGLFKHPFLRELLEFPVLFLGALPQNTPALYSLMNYADMQLGTWYPQGGMFNIIEAFLKIAKEQGVEINLNQEVYKLQSENGVVSRVVTKDKVFETDIVIGAGDYQYIDQVVLEPKQRSYSSAYWDSRKLAPSCLIYYLGINKKLNSFLHHTLYFDTDFDVHSKEIYSNPTWPKNPLFYVSVPSRTDSSVAPLGMENVFILIPIAPGLEGDTEELREQYLQKILERIEKQTGENLTDSIIFKRTYSVKDFVSDYHAFKGNAYGLANTLGQTAILKPSIKSKKLKNLFYTGQLTVPGPGVPPTIISGKVVANQIEKEFGLARNSINGK